MDIGEMADVAAPAMVRREWDHSCAGQLTGLCECNAYYDREMPVLQLQVFYDALERQHESDVYY